MPASTPVGSGVPAGPPAHRDRDDRTDQRNRLILRVFGAQQPIPGVHRLAAGMNRGDTIGADPPQLCPIIGVVVDEQTDLWIAFDVG